MSRVDSAQSYRAQCEQVLELLCGEMPIALHRHASSPGVITTLPLIRIFILMARTCSTPGHSTSNIPLHDLPLVYLLFNAAKRSNEKGEHQSSDRLVRAPMTSCEQCPVTGQDKGAPLSGKPELTTGK